MKEENHNMNDLRSCGVDSFINYLQPWVPPPQRCGRWITLRSEPLPPESLRMRMLRAKQKKEDVSNDTEVGVFMVLKIWLETKMRFVTSNSPLTLCLTLL